MTAQKSQRQRRAQRSSWQKPDFGLRIPSSGTDAAIQYFLSFRQINSFLRYILRMAGHIDSTAQRAHEVLVKTAEDPIEKAKLIKDWESRQGAIDDLKKHRQFLMEIVLVRHIENYLNYLSSLLREIFLARPETLSSNEKIELETIIRHNSIDDLIRTITERKVESLSYTSFFELAKYFEEKFHINLVQNEDLEAIVDAVETRNISVHNRCVVNHRFISRTKSNADALGTLRKLWIQDIEDVAYKLGASVKSVDAAARKRLRVKGHHFPKT